MDEEALTALAFGPDAGPADSIPRDGSPRQRLLAAIVLGARGRYAAAAELLDPLRRGRNPLTASLAASTLASHRRQLGAHVVARRLDGEALLAVGLRGVGERGAATAGGGPGLAGSGPGLAGGGPGLAGSGLAAAGSGSRGVGSGPAGTGADSPVPGSTSATTGSPPATASPSTSASQGSLVESTEDPDGLDLQGARADAFLGLAADNLALGRISAARRLAVRAAQADRRWRSTVRGGWVGAEIELAAGQPEAAVAPARLAYETAVARHARRHIVKSGIVLGVALLAAGQDGARELLVAAAADAEKYELDSLGWVADRVAADVDHDRAEEYRFRSRQVLHAVLRRADPCVMRIAHESPWVPIGPG
ncbi:MULTISPECIES: hypothetical protein [Amycolatopsis]|uniref:hypothetical protein n=1 Tax=Amycolatopsis TaxID=1813 RepID=UPI0007E08D6C|nr:hypothetical protein [Amycolatopsis sp. M39]OAP23074.1 hypothetical protein A4R44_06156 [Amycolatopsis sp. M39]